MSSAVIPEETGLVWWGFLPLTAEASALIKGAKQIKQTAIRTGIHTHKHTHALKHMHNPNQIQRKYLIKSKLWGLGHIYTTHKYTTHGCINILCILRKTDENQDTDKPFHPWKKRTFSCYIKTSSSKQDLDVIPVSKKTTHRLQNPQNICSLSPQTLRNPKSI